MAGVNLQYYTWNVVLVSYFKSFQARQRLRHQHTDRTKIQLLACLESDRSDLTTFDDFRASSCPRYLQRTSGSLPRWKCHFAGQTLPSYVRRRDTVSDTFHKTKPPKRRAPGRDNPVIRHRHLDQRTTILPFLCVCSVFKRIYKL